MDDALEHRMNYVLGRQQVKLGEEGRIHSFSRVVFGVWLINK